MVTHALDLTALDIAREPKVQLDDPTTSNSDTGRKQKSGSLLPNPSNQVPLNHPTTSTSDTDREETSASLLPNPSNQVRLNNPTTSTSDTGRGETSGSLLHSPSNQAQLDDPTTPASDTDREETPGNLHPSPETFEGLWSKFGLFGCLIITTAISSLLLAGSISSWTGSGRFYRMIISNRASVQLAVQLLSHLLGLIQATAVCRIVNYSTRLRMEQKSVSLDTIHLWSKLSLARMDCSLRLRLVLPLLAFISIISAPAAFWAGAITPVPTLASRETTVYIPRYNNMSLIAEYPTQVEQLGPILRTAKGMFSFSVGMKYLGSIFSSAATATPLDGSVRLHPKYDNSRFVYVGRSYGVGAAVGLADDSIFEDELAVSYSYRESGYEPLIHCIYNRSSEFVLSETGQHMLYAAGGYLPDSNGEAEYSVYIGYGSSAIVAIGVSHASTSPKRYLAIAAGSSYAMLNDTQCTIDFIPSLFDVSVGLPGKNITVSRLGDAPDVDPTRNMTKIAMRQLEFIANDQTNIYVSLLGDSLNSSIADYVSATLNQTNHTPTAEESVLAGITNSFTAMIDDILVCFASAQLMITEDTELVPTLVSFNAFRFGQDSYIYAIFAINSLVVLGVLGEATRMRGWKGLSTFNYIDPRNLIISASRAGKDVAYVASKVERTSNPSSWKTFLGGTNREIGQIRVQLRDRTGLALVLASRDGIGKTESTSSLLSGV